MSPLTVFLGKLIGLYCIIVALAVMAHRQSTVESVKALIRNPPLLLVLEVIALIAGLAMVLGHNIWSGGAGGHRHPHRLAGDDAWRRAARPVGGCEAQTLRGAAL